MSIPTGATYTKNVQYALWIKASMLLCNVMLCYAMLCMHVMLPYVCCVSMSLCYLTLHYITLCHCMMLCYVMLESTQRFLPIMMAGNPPMLACCSSMLKPILSPLSPVPLIHLHASPCGGGVFL